MTPQEQHARHLTAQTIVEGLSIVNEPKIENLVTVEWSTRMTSTAGYATWMRKWKRIRELKFSAVIMPHCPDEEIRQIALHELAHLVSVERYGTKEGKGHGRRWKQTMRELGARVERCHSYHELPAVIRAAGFPVTQCRGCGRTRGVTKRKATNMRRYGCAYRCRTCAGDVYLLSPQERHTWLEAQR